MQGSFEKRVRVVSPSARTPFEDARAFEQLELRGELFAGVGLLAASEQIAKAGFHAFHARCEADLLWVGREQIPLAAEGVGVAAQFGVGDGGLLGERAGWEIQHGSREMETVLCDAWILGRQCHVAFS